MTRGRWISLMLVVCFSAHAIWLHPVALVMVAGIWMLLPLAAIWFGDEFGSSRSFRFSHEATPGIVLRTFGWLLLLTTPFIVLGTKARWETQLP